MRNKSLPGSFRRNKLVLSGLLGILLVWCLLQGSYAAAGKRGEKQVHLGKALKGRLPITELSGDEAILHALNVLGFGPRPGEVERVRRMGLEKWIEQQLNPQSLDDSALNARLQHYPTLTMSTARLLQEFPPRQAAAKPAGPTPAAMGSNRPAPQPPRLKDIGGPQRVDAELALAKMERAIYSERQLYEVMVDFWMNHFNVFAGKGADRWLLTSYERDAIRPHSLGKFKNLLLATAQSPAMLFYLDNWQSVDPEAFERMQREIAERRQQFQEFLGRTYPLQLGPFPPQPPQPAKAGVGAARRGLNENYGRELMELHTLGVEGGYTQQDVTEAARAFTGWTIRPPRRDAEFYFAERLHSNGVKMVLGKKIHAGGMKDGLEVLDLLAHHPSTAKFISFKLAQRFVSDQPPQELVDRMAKTFLQTDGDIRAVLGAMIYSPEFWSRGAYRAKVKMPFELVASTVRALGLDVEEPIPLVRWTARIGEPLYQCLPPTGYSDKADTWVNTGALLNRMNFALALAGSRLPGIKMDLKELLGPEAQTNPQQALDRSIQVFLGGNVSPQSRATLEDKMNDPRILRAQFDDPVRQVDLGLIAGLVLGSPEFQRR